MSDTPTCFFLTPSFQSARAGREALMTFFSPPPFRPSAFYYYSLSSIKAYADKEHAASGCHRYYYLDHDDDEWKRELITLAFFLAPQKRKSRHNNGSTCCLGLYQLRHWHSCCRVMIHAISKGEALEIYMAFLKQLLAKLCLEDCIADELHPSIF